LMLRRYGAGFDAHGCRPPPLLPVFWPSWGCSAACSPSAWNWCGDAVGLKHAFLVRLANSSLWDISIQAEAEAEQLFISIQGRSKGL
jgi:hypothetical protein